MATQSIVSQVWERAPGCWVTRLVVDGKAYAREHSSLALANVHLEKMAAFWRRDVEAYRAAEDRQDGMLGR